MCREDNDFEEMNTGISFALIIPIMRNSLVGNGLGWWKVPKKSIRNLHWSQTWVQMFWKHASYNTTCRNCSHIDLEDMTGEDNG